VAASSTTVVPAAISGSRQRRSRSSEVTAAPPTAAAAVTHTSRTTADCRSELTSSTIRSTQAGCVASDSALSWSMRRSWISSSSGPS
jgi:hypothetical protein